MTNLLEKDDHSEGASTQSIEHPEILARDKACPGRDRNNNRFKYGTWEQVEIDGKDHRVLFSSSSTTGRTVGYIVGKPLTFRNEGSNVHLADIVHCEQRGETGQRKRICRLAGVQVIMKTFKDEETAQREANILDRASSGLDRASKVVRMIDSLMDESTIYIVQEYLAGGDLFCRVSSAPDQRISIPMALSWFSDLLQALIQLKQRGIAHMDLSPEVRGKTTFGFFFTFLSLTLTNPWYFFRCPVPTERLARRDEPLQTHRFRHVHRSA